MASRKDSSPASFNDVKFVMDLALQKPGLQYVLKTYGAAVNFKQRCNKYRNLVRDMVAESLAGSPGFRAETAYDPLVIHQCGADLKPDRKGCILVFHHQEVEGTLIDPETGKEIEIPGVTNVLREF